MEKEKNKYFGKIEKERSKRLKNSRYRHTIGVAHTAACLAMRYGQDSDKAYLAGLLHDAAKHYDNKDMLKKAKAYGMPMTDFDQEHPDMLHAAVGAKIARMDFGIEDEDVLASIRNHTVGRAGMSPLEEIIFVADYVENGRDKAPELDHVRWLAFNDIRECIKVILFNTLKYLKEDGEDVDERIKAVTDYYGLEVEL